jgi:hypothetical protein
MAMASLRKTDIIYISFVLLTASLLLAFAIFFLQFKYDSLISWTVSVFHKNGLESFLRAQAFPFQKFRFLQKFCYAMLIFIPVGVFILLNYKNKIGGWLRFTLQSIFLNLCSLIAVYQSNSKTENRILGITMILIAGRSLFYITHWDLQYDEMWSYNYFTAQPFYYTFFMYNNYPLYELSTALFKALPFAMKINLRLPSLLSGLITCLILYGCLKAYFRNTFSAFAGLVCFAFFPIVNCYMLYGRGVMPEILFASISFFSILFWIREPERTDRLVIFSLATIGGLFAMPTHIYYWLLLIALTGIINPDKKQLINFWYANAAAAIGCALCYLPMALGSGFHFITDLLKQRDSVGIILGHLPIDIGRVSFFIFGTQYGIYFTMAIAIFLVVTCKNKKLMRFPVWFVLGLLILPFMSLLVQRFYIPPRAFGFISLILPILAAVLFHKFNYRISKTSFSVINVCLGIAGLLISHFHDSINWSKISDRKAKEVSEILLENNVVSCYDNSGLSAFPYNYPAVEYYYRQEHKNILFTLNTTGSIRYKPFVFSDHYDCIIAGIAKPDSEMLDKYRLVYRDTAGKFQIFVLKRV